MNIRSLSTDEFKEILTNDNALKHIVQTGNREECISEYSLSNGIWLNNVNDGKLYAGNVVGIYEPINREYIKSQENIKPVLFDPVSSYTIGDIYLIGKDKWNLPLRWVAVGDHLLILVDCPVFCFEKGICSCEDYDEEMGNFIKSSFSRDEIEAIENGSLKDKLTPYDGALKICSNVDVIPKYRYIRDSYMKELHILPRSKSLIIEDSAFSYCHLERITGLDYYTVIKPNAFRLTHIEGDLILGNIDQIGESAFESSHINKIIFKGVVGTIGDMAFEGNPIRDIDFSESGFILKSEGCAFLNNKHITEEVKKKYFERVVVEYDMDTFWDIPDTDPSLPF